MKLSNENPGIDVTAHRERVKKRSVADSWRAVGRRGKSDKQRIRMESIAEGTGAALAVSTIFLPGIDGH